MLKQEMFHIWKNFVTRNGKQTSREF